MSDTVGPMILLQVGISDGGMCTHDIFEGIGGEETIPRKELFPLLKLLEKVGKLERGSGIDSRGKLGFKWSIPIDD